MDKTRPVILLIMDGDADASEALHILEKYRFANEVKRVRRTREALRLFSGEDARENPCELIIFASMDPGPSQLAPAAASLRRETGDTPIILVASSREEEEELRALGLPRTHCLSKPLGFFKLLEAMQKVGMYWTVAKGK